MTDTHGSPAQRGLYPGATRHLTVSTEAAPAGGQ